MSLLFLQLRGEMRKLFARKRTYIGFGAYVVLEILVLCLFQLQKVQASWRHMIERAGGGFEHYFSGTTLALIVVMATFLLTMLYLALIGGDVVAKEVEEGTMRMALCRPISRVRLLLLKYVACVIYNFVLVAFVGGTALLACTLREGPGGLFAMAPEQNIVALFDTQEGLVRYGAALFFYALSSLSITTVAFMLSCFNMKPATATIVTLSAFIIDWIFYHLPYFSSIKEYFLTHNMTTWVHIFLQRVPWTLMAQDYAYLLAVDATFVIVGVVSVSAAGFQELAGALRSQRLAEQVEDGGVLDEALQFFRAIAAADGDDILGGVGSGGHEEGGGFGLRAGRLGSVGAGGAGCPGD